MRWNRHQQKIERRQRFRSQPAYKNPLYMKTSWQQFIIERIGFFGWLLILIILVIAYTLFYSPLFRITTVDIQGTQNISVTTLKERYVDWQLQQKRLKLFPQNNMFMFSGNWLKDLIGKDYSLSSLVIKKQWPHTLSITLTEKTPELVWVTGGSYFYLSETGDIASRLVDQNAASGVPTFFDDSNTATTVGQPVLTKEKVSFIKGLIDQLKQVTAVEIVAYHMPAGLSVQVNALTKAGYSIYFDATKELGAQVEKLKRVLADPAFTEKPAKEYIDVRLGDRVYYK